MRGYARERVYITLAKLPELKSQECNLPAYDFWYLLIFFIYEKIIPPLDGY
jgi:hypothetical protein